MDLNQPNPSQIIQLILDGTTTTDEFTQILKFKSIFFEFFFHIEHELAQLMKNYIT